MQSTCLREVRNNLVGSRVAKLKFLNSGSLTPLINSFSDLNDEQQLLALSCFHVLIHSFPSDCISLANLLINVVSSSESQNEADPRSLAAMKSLSLLLQSVNCDVSFALSTSTADVIVSFLSSSFSPTTNHAAANLLNLLLPSLPEPYLISIASPLIHHVSHLLSSPHLSRIKLPLSDSLFSLLRSFSLSSPQCASNVASLSLSSERSSSFLSILYKLMSTTCHSSTTRLSLVSVLASLHPVLATENPCKYAADVVYYTRESLEPMFNYKVSTSDSHLIIRTFLPSSMRSLRSVLDSNGLASEIVCSLNIVCDFISCSPTFQSNLISSNGVSAIISLLERCVLVIGTDLKELTIQQDPFISIYRLLLCFTANHSDLRAPIMQSIKLRGFLLDQLHAYSKMIGDNVVISPLSRLRISLLCKVLRNCFRSLEALLTTEISSLDISAVVSLMFSSDSFISIPAICCFSNLSLELEAVKQVTLSRNVVDFLVSKYVTFLDNSDLDFAHFAACSLCALCRNWDSQIFSKILECLSQEAQNRNDQSLILTLLCHETSQLDTLCLLKNIVYKSAEVVVVACSAGNETFSPSCSFFSTLVSIIGKPFTNDNSIDCSSDCNNLCLCSAKAVDVIHNIAIIEENLKDFVLEIPGLSAALRSGLSQSFCESTKVRIIELFWVLLIPVDRNQVGSPQVSNRISIINSWGFSPLFEQLRNASSNIELKLRVGDVINLLSNHSSPSSPSVDLTSSPDPLSDPSLSLPRLDLDSVERSVPITSAVGGFLRSMLESATDFEQTPSPLVFDSQSEDDL
ncbi:hypothetical protein RCL1_005200 [Eukaryota sp. TZLM3-RCL]